MSDEVFQIHNETEFNDQVLSTKDSVVIGFFAPNCDSCATVNSRTQQVIEDMNGKIHMVKKKSLKVNIAELSDLSKKYGVTSTPLLAVARNGEVKKKKLSGMPEMDEIQKFIEDSIGKEDE
uniref:Thioredoxin n=1 Tax=Polypedilum vanderplanki TaxID=319348 RepID=S6CDH6_POLVA|nr:thioredoxin [Polypedilum vanderplanki]